MGYARKRTASENTTGAKRTKIVIEPKPVSLNTRIVRALQSRLETKRYFNDSTISLDATSQVKAYVNPLSGIVAGGTSTDRVGDQIHVESIEFFFTYFQGSASRSDAHFEGNLVRNNTSGAFVNSDMAVYSGPNLHYIGFPTNGPDNKEAYTFHGKKKMMFLSGDHIAASSTDTLMMWTHKVNLNRKVTYLGTGTSIKGGDFIYVMGIDAPLPVVSGEDSATLSCNYLVTYKDA